MNEEMVRRIEAWFDSPWRHVPSQPVLYLFVWIAGIHVIATPDNALIGFSEAGFSGKLYYAWNILILASPVMVAISWLLIHRHHGSSRVWGFWLRLGGDLGVLGALIALILTRVLLLSGSMGDSPLFSLITLTGVAAMVAAFVVRDVGAVILLERFAHSIRKNAGES